MHNMTFVVRRSDKNGKQRTKEYEDEESARRAKQWLIDQGVTLVDIALKKKEYSNASRENVLLPHL